MVVVAGMWELGWNTPEKEFSLWHFPLQDFGVEDFYMTPIVEFQNAFIRQRQSMKEVIEECGGLTKVFVDERSDVELQDFEHPDDALYIFGKANHPQFLNLKREEDMAVKIMTQENLGLMWPHQAMLVILYDRIIKNGS